MSERNEGMRGEVREGEQMRGSGVRGEESEREERGGSEREGGMQTARSDAKSDNLTARIHKSAQAPFILPPSTPAAGGTHLLCVFGFDAPLARLAHILPLLRAHLPCD